jgi:hypothetical protein
LCDEPRCRNFGTISSLSRGRPTSDKWVSSYNYAIIWHILAFLLVHALANVTLTVAQNKGSNGTAAGYHLPLYSGIFKMLCFLYLSLCCNSLNLETCAHLLNVRSAGAINNFEKRTKYNMNKLLLCVKNFFFIKFFFTNTCTFLHNSV